MGGHLLSNWNLPEKRVPRAEFDKLTQLVLEQIKYDFPTYRAEIIPFYKDKEDFGDMDLLVEVKPFENNWLEWVKERYCATPHKNGNVISFPLEGFQVDLILVGTDSFDTAKTYFACETGNFMGRIADKLGFKYGHKGLWLHVPLNYFNADLPNHEFRDILITKDPARIFSLLGFDYEWFLKGFDNLEEMFKWVAASRFFAPQLFSFDALNSINRTRNRKRPVYAQFVEWCETQEARGIPSKEVMFVKTLVCFVHLQPELEKIRIEVLRNKLRREKFNGDLVRELKNIQTGPELGQFIMNFKKKYCQPNFEQWLDDNSKENVWQAIQSFQNKNL